jgi:hypothetical protein
VDHVVRHATNQGLARTFRTGLDIALMLRFPGASHEVRAREIRKISGKCFAATTMGELGNDRGPGARTSRLVRPGEQGHVCRAASEGDIPHCTISGARLENSTR